MKIFGAAFTVLFVFVPASLALQCYDCMWSSGEGMEMGTTDCMVVNSNLPYSQTATRTGADCNYCVTQTVETETYYSVMRSCIPQCTPGESNFNGYGSWVTCCSWDLCNNEDFVSISNKATHASTSTATTLLLVLLHGTVI